MKRLKVKKPGNYQELLFEDITGKNYRVSDKCAQKLGAGFTENIYEKAIVHELCKLRIPFVNQSIIKVEYDGILLGNQRVD